jgi:hypothetical protein
VVVLVVVVLVLLVLVLVLLQDELVGAAMRLLDPKGN